MRKEFAISENTYEEIREFVTSKYIKDAKGKKKDFNSLMLLIEESVHTLIENKNENTKKILVNAYVILGEVYIVLKCQGKEYSLQRSESIDSIEGLEGSNDTIEDDIRYMILDKMSDNISYSHSRGRNIITITTEKDKHKELFATLGAMLAGILFGVLLRVVLPGTVADVLLDRVCQPFSQMFINALHMLVGPIVFLAMICCISQFRSISDLGKIGGRLILLYTMTTVIAICLGFLLYHIFPVGDPSLATYVDSMVEETLDADDEEAEEFNEAQELAENNDFLTDMVVQIVPDNIVDPFKNANLLQILFVAIILGIGVSAVSARFPVLLEIFQGLNEVFMTVMGLICKLIPVAVFCNMASLVYNTGFEVLRAIFGYVLLAVGGVFCMMMMYCVLIAIMGRMNPIHFVKKYWKTALTALSLSSSTAAMPLSMESCKKMGISDKITSFSIPIGSTINMDGSSLVMGIVCLFLAKVYNLELTPALLVSIAFSIILLSMGAPSMAGADLAIIVILIAQIGIPSHAIVLIMGIDTILDMVQAMSNTTGDAAVALILSRITGDLDMEKYRS